MFLTSRNLSVIILVLYASVPSRAQDPVERQPPRSLLAFREARRQINSGRIDWTVALPDNVRTMHYVSRYAANGDMIFENRGDEDGWTQFDLAGAGSSKFPHLYLHTQGTIWNTEKQHQMHQYGLPAHPLLP